MESIKIFFTDFWKGFQIEDNYFIHLFSKRFRIELNENPDFLIYGPYGKNHRRYKCLKIFYTSENVRPNFWECDYAFSFDYYFNERHYRLPLYALYDDVNCLTYHKDVAKAIAQKTKFCNFVYSNHNAKERVEFFNKLSKYKKVDSGGSVLNNIGFKVTNKLQFLSEYKFTIAFENESYPGYTTEKIFQPMLVNSIPIYWGNPYVFKDFNTKSFINVHDFDSYDKVIERIIEIDNDLALYKELLEQPYFHNNKVPTHLESDKILNCFEGIFNSKDSSKVVSTSFKPIISYLSNDFKFYTRVFMNKYRKMS